MTTIYGSVTNTSNAGVAGRVVRAYRRDTGALLGSAVTSDGSDIPADPSWASVKAFMTFEGAEDSTTFTDLSTNAGTVTVYGNAKITNTDPEFNGGALTLDGAGDYLQVSIPSFNIRTSQWSLEFDTKITSASGAYVTFGATGHDLYLQRIGNTFYLGDGSTNVMAQSEHISLNTFTKVAMTFDGTTYRLFTGGVLRISTTTLLKDFSVSNMFIGARPGEGQFMAGRIDNLRLTLGVCRYTANYTPLTTPFPSTPQPGLPVGDYEIPCGSYAGDAYTIVLAPASDKNSQIKDWLTPT